jgi:hypothetical protein
MKTHTDISLQPGKLRQTGSRDWVTRFAFGAATSALSAVLSQYVSPRIGGVFLAFPAILLASLTLVAEEEGRTRARDDARGAFFGTMGMVAFAVVIAILAARIPAWATFSAGVAAWVTVALGSYFIGRRFRAGHDT